MKQARITPSSGNVFRDLGFSRAEAARLSIRSDLMIRLQVMIAEGGLTQREVANRLRISQPRVSDLMRGRLELFSVDSLIEMLAGMGASVRVIVKAARHQKRVAQP